MLNLKGLIFQSQQQQQQQSKQQLNYLQKAPCDKSLEVENKKVLLLSIIKVIRKVSNLNFLVFSVDCYQ